VGQLETRQNTGSTKKINNTNGAERTYIRGKAFEQQPLKHISEIQMFADETTKKDVKKQGTKKAFAQQICKSLSLCFLFAIFLCCTFFHKNRQLHICNSIEANKSQCYLMGRQWIRFSCWHKSNLFSIFSTDPRTHKRQQKLELSTGRAQRRKFRAK